MNKDEKIYIAGHRGLVGSSVIRNLKANGYENIIGRTKSELDLREQNPCLLYTSPSPRDRQKSRMPSSA